MPDVSTPRQRAWLRRHGWIVAALCMALALGIDGGYQIYAARISSRNARAAETTKRNAKTIAATAEKVTKLSKAACAQTQLLFDVFNALAVDSSPRFGSPPDGPILPGARTALIGRLTVSERTTAKALKGQGCRITTP